MAGYGPNQSTEVGGTEMLLFGLLVTFLGQSVLFLKPFGRSARGWRRKVYAGALAARMLFIVLLIRVLFLVFLSQ